MLESILQYSGQAIIVLGILITGFGVYAFLRLQSFYARLVITAKVEAMGFAVIIIGTMILSGVSIGTLKLAVILFFELLTVSIGAHAIARSAWKSGYHLPPVGPTETNNG